MEPTTVYLTTSEVAEKARVTPSTVRRWVDNGDLVPAIITPGRRYRFDPETVDAMLSPPEARAS
jgi:excisionase family DNA binding protein